MQCVLFLFCRLRTKSFTDYMNGPLDIGGQFGGQEVFVKRLGQLSKYIYKFQQVALLPNII